MMASAEMMDMPGMTSNMDMMESMGMSDMMMSSAVDSIQTTPQASLGVGLFEQTDLGLSARAVEQSNALSNGFPEPFAAASQASQSAFQYEFQRDVFSLELAPEESLQQDPEDDDKSESDTDDDEMMAKKSSLEGEDMRPGIMPADSAGADLMPTDDAAAVNVNETAAAELESVEDESESSRTAEVDEGDVEPVDVASLDSLFSEDDHQSQLSSGHKAAAGTAFGLVVATQLRTTSKTKNRKRTDRLRAPR